MGVIFKGVVKEVHVKMFLVYLEKAFEIFDHNMLLENMGFIDFNKSIMKYQLLI